MVLKITVPDAESIPRVENFVRAYSRHFIYTTFLSRVNTNRLQPFDEEFDINSLNALKYALKNLLVTKQGENAFIIKFDNTLKYDDHPIGFYVNLITYGTRQIKGYSIILDVFEEVKEDLPYMYSAFTNRI